MNSGVVEITKLDEVPVGVGTASSPTANVVEGDALSVADTAALGEIKVLQDRAQRESMIGNTPEEVAVMLASRL